MAVIPCVCGQQFTQAALMRHLVRCRVYLTHRARETHSKRR